MLSSRRLRCSHDVPVGRMLPKGTVGQCFPGERVCMPINSGVNCVGCVFLVEATMAGSGFGAATPVSGSNRARHDMAVAKRVRKRIRPILSRISMGGIYLFMTCLLYTSDAADE